VRSLFIGWSRKSCALHGVTDTSCLNLAAGENIVSQTDAKGTAAEHIKKDDGVDVDEQNERMVVEAIRYFYPDHRIIGDPTEQGVVPELTMAPTWIVDPVDGTTNFDSGLPLTCVSIGLCVDGKPVMGVVYAPSTNELYVGIRGHGAFRNAVRITVSKEVKKLTEAVVNFEFGYARADVAQCVRNIMKNGVKTTRCLGSGVLDFCYVATGRLDVVFAGIANEGWKPWDYCAAYVIVKEAGAAMESLLDQKPGEELNLYGSSIVCATSQELLEETRRVCLGDM
jgi:fructose-1,6-bisphosphatase/inositol monophosphatase family enzyme